MLDVRRLFLMKRTAATSVLLILFCCSEAAGQFEPERWAKAERDIPRLSPSSYTGLPRPIARFLLRHGYTIPQAYDYKGQHNVVRGRFNNDRSTDWAILASRDGSSQILVFWSGSPARVTRLRRKPDANFLQSYGGDIIGYSRVISVANRKDILFWHREFGGPKPPPIRHDGIDDAFSGKASGIHYFDGKRWHQLQGAD